MSDHTLSSPGEPRTSRRGRVLLERAAAFVRTEYGLVVLALAVVGLHVVDDNYLRPAPGTAARDHLASGLVPIAIIVGVAVAYPYLRVSLRAATAMTLGAIGVAFGLPAAYHLLDGSASGSDSTGLLAIVAGAVLLALGPGTLWRARRPGGSPRRRYLRRSLAAAIGAGAAAAIVVFVVFPIGFSYGYTHIGPTGSAPTIGVPLEHVTLRTSDQLDLAASYVPSRNRAAVVVFPGASAVREARMLVRHGYGVLLVDPRGQGGSEGDLVRWAGDRDLLAAAAYLGRRSDVDPARIGGFGSSVGGETLLEAAAQSTAFRAVVSEGAGFRIGEADFTGPAKVLFAPLKLVMTASTTVFSNHGPPPRIVDRIGEIAPRPVFLIYAEPGMGGEAVRQPEYYAAAGQPKAIWKVAGAEHTGGIDARPAEYERRVIAFFDGALLRD